MIKLSDRLPIRLQCLEWVIATLLVWLALIAVPLSLGQLSLSWDALNHHIYLGWTAENQRLERDYLAAGVQAFQFPYTYWPAYYLAISGASGLVAGVLLNTLHAMLAPAIWLVAKICIPGQTVYDALMRLFGTILAFLSPVVVSLLDTTSNDLISAAPLVWAVAVAILSHNPPTKNQHAAFFYVVFSGLLTGVSVALKLSNGPLAILLPGLWWFAGRSFSTKFYLTFIGCGATLLGFVLIYGYWGYLLWTHFGNPIYPFFNDLFDPLRRLTGWRP
jgi:hypothetical protein